ncbi:MAG: tetratricopeptide repeat protein [Nitrospirae bacterium]|nr:tetratricopeptide repeat protein [Nitrospirota bacterium]
MRRRLFIPLFLRPLFLWPLFLWAVPAQAGEAERVFESVRDSVVTITTLDERGQIDGEGSGVVVAPGLVITNCHVVQEASAIRVRSGDKEFNSSVMLWDAQRDLCRLEVSGLAAPTVRIRGYRDVQAGESVYAVGNPLGFGLSVSAGIVSAIGRFRGEPQVFTSAPISPGSSGGGLFDSQGRLIGVTTRLFSGAQNLNVALPADWITELPQRGAPARKATVVAGPDPDWLAQAESLRTSAQWTKLAEWARSWRETYPTSAEAGAFLGLALSNMRQLQEAKGVLLTALQHDPRHATALSYLAKVRRGLGEKEAAMVDLRRALALRPAQGYFHRALAEWQRDDGAIDEAVKTIQTALRLQPWDEIHWQTLGGLRHVQKRYEEAVEAYRTVLRLNPNNPAVTSSLAGALAALGDGNAARQVLATISAGQAYDALTWVSLGVREGKQGRNAEAERAFRKALEIDPAMPEAWHNLAFSLMRTNRTKDAEDALRHALKYKPDFARAWADLGVLLSQRGDKSQAREAFEKAAAADSSFSFAWYNLAIVRRELRDLPGAAMAADAAARLDPSNGAVRAYLGEILLRLGRPEEALKALLEAERLDPKNGLALAGLSMYYGMRGEPGKALGYAERALEINPASPESWSNKGYSLLKLKRYPEAVKALETAIRLQPDLANPWINLGESYLHQRQLGKAIAALEQAVKLAPTAPDARLYVAQAYTTSGQHTKAKEHLNALLGQAPNLVPAWYLLAAVNVAQDNRQEALEAYAKLKSLDPTKARELWERSRKQGLPLSFDLPE